MTFNNSSIWLTHRLVNDEKINFSRRMMANKKTKKKKKRNGQPRDVTARILPASAGAPTSADRPRPTDAAVRAWKRASRARRQSTTPGLKTKIPKFKMSPPPYLGPGMRSIAGFFHSIG